jgi:hypothetical protein
VPVAAAIIGDECVRAVLAARDMVAERCGAAALDCAHHLHLVEAEVPGIGSAPRRPVVAEDVRDLQHWTGHNCQPLRRQLGFPAPPGLFARQRQQIERALEKRRGGGGGLAIDSYWLLASRTMKHHREHGVVLLDGPGRREAARRHPGVMRGTSACRAKRGTPGAIFDIVSWDVAADGVGHAARTFRSTNVEDSAGS